MNNKGIGLIIIIVIIIATLTFLFSRAFDDPNNTNVPVHTDILTGDTIDNVDTMSVAHAFGGGLHTYVGEIDLPTPCHELNHTITIAESFPEQVTIDFITKTETEVCAQYIIPEPFSVSFTASREAQVSMTLNKEPLLFRELSLDVPDMFEEFEEEEKATTTEEKAETEEVN
ncbi:MAG: hypothetical protein KAS07_00825 [Candidatus Pacebacteria bacterium]|nr:hypothetical protein [Candidatus Paceibacterota bacterium]